MLTDQKTFHKILGGKAIMLVILLFPAVCVAQIPGYIPANGLMAWYPFTGNANDASGNLHHGTVNGPSLTTDRFATTNAAYMFGTNKFISVPDNPSNFRPSNFSISTWVTFTSSPFDYHLILAKNVGNGSPESIDINYANGYNGWFCNIGDANNLGPFLISTQTISTGPWYNVVYVFNDLTNTQKIYVNGVLTATGSVNMSVGYDAQPWTIGMEYEGGVPSFYFPGKIDDIGIWDRELTPAEVLEVFCSVDLLTQPQNQSVFAGGNATFVAVSGNPNSSYQWQRATGGPFTNLTNGGQFSGVTTSTLTVSAVTALNDNDMYRCIISTAPCTHTSAVANLTLNTTSLAEHDKLIGEVYPNPFGAQLFFDYLGSQSAFYSLCDLTGRVLFAGTVHHGKNVVETKDLAGGVYFLKLTGGFGNYSLKLVKQ